MLRNIGAKVAFVLADVTRRSGGPIYQLRHVKGTRMSEFLEVFSNCSYCHVSLNLNRWVDPNTIPATFGSPVLGD
jgi:hypothetical protein